MQALQAFCAEYTPDEMSFDDWCSCEERLDLQLFLTLSPEEARAGGTRDMKYSRSISQKSGSGEVRKSREQSQCSITYPPGIQTGAVLVIEGAGDRCGDRVGDLRITVRVK